MPSWPCLGPRVGPRPGIIGGEDLLSGGNLLRGPTPNTGEEAT